MFGKNRTIEGGVASTRILRYYIYIYMYIYTYCGCVYIQYYVVILAAVQTGKWDCNSPMEAMTLQSFYKTARQFPWLYWKWSPK